jgi:hypothetical protein
MTPPPVPPTRMSGQGTPAAEGGRDALPHPGHRTRAGPGRAAAPTGDGAILSCRVPDRAGLTGLVALLADLGIDIADLQAVTEVC